MYFCVLPGKKYAGLKKVRQRRYRRYWLLSGMQTHCHWPVCKVWKVFPHWHPKEVKGCHKVWDNSEFGHLKNGVNLPHLGHICSASFYLLAGDSAEPFDEGKRLIWWWSGGCEVVCSRSRQAQAGRRFHSSPEFSPPECASTTTTAPPPAAIRHGKGKRANWPFGEIIRGIVT